jgi:hypothetical protein
MMAIAFGLLIQPGVRNCNSVAGMPIYSSDILDSTVCVEKCTGANRRVSLAPFNDIVTRVLGTTANVSIER